MKLVPPAELIKARDEKRAQVEAKAAKKAAAVEAEDVLRLQVAVVDPEVVARLDGIEDLEEDMLDKLVVLRIRVALDDRGEQIAAPAGIKDEVDVLLVLEGCVEGEDGRV